MQMLKTKKFDLRIVLITNLHSISDITTILRKTNLFLQVKDVMKFNFSFFMIILVSKHPIGCERQLIQQENETVNL